MQTYEPEKWRTDLIVFVENDLNYFKNDTSFLNQLNCSFSHKRISELDMPMCTLIHYVSLKKRNLPQFADNMKRHEKYDHLLTKIDVFNDDEQNLLPFLHILKSGLSHYGYLDSILMAFEGYNYLKAAGYDYLIRSDMDVFLTPLFSKWLPENCNDFAVGGGGYSDEFNKNRLTRIAHSLELKHAGVLNLGI